jgi:hypothetical protein
MADYFSEVYFIVIVSLIGAYLLVWLAAWFLTLPFWGIISKGGNPYPAVYTCWKGPMMAHTILLLVACGFTVYDLAASDRGSEPIIYYSIGYAFLIFVNILLIFRANSYQSKIKFRT